MIGQYGAKLDEKNRLIVPAKLREELGDRFFVTLGVNGRHKCLTAYTEPEWKTFCEKYDALSISQRSGATNLFFYKAVECVPDKQFRIALSNSLITYAGIEHELVIVGRAGQAEIWDAAEYNRFENENLTPDHLLASLEAIGL